MPKNYKTENWKKTSWKGTKRETTTTKKVLVKRDQKGHFISVIHKVQKKTYGSGVYNVGILHGKIVTRQKIAGRNVLWYEQRAEAIKEKHKKPIYRTSYVLNNVPISKNGYYGFRIVAFARNPDLLSKIRPKLKQKLIEWIEKCIKYSKDDFWFDMYFGYEKPSLSNSIFSDSGNYNLTMENDKGIVIKESSGRIEFL